ncbi:MAG TPA: DHHA1 domain-containing protein [Conexivisphaerales archaeon]|nr:DHHA1 domain-containing protein [Conexivisphaerales archaeon]
MDVSEAEAAAHTAEHIFIRSLQNAKVELTVHMVEQDGFRGRIKLSARNLDWGKVASAMESTNLQIAAGLPVKETSYPSVEAARRDHPLLRTREERLNGEVRVIEIGDFDVASCAHSHAGSSRDALLFAVTDFHSAAGDSYEVSFLTGPEAIAHFAKLTLERVEVGRLLRSRHDDIVEASARVEAEVSSLKGSLGSLTARLVSELTPAFVEGGVELFAAELGPVASHVLLSEVGGAVKSGRKVFILGYADDGSPSVLLARSPGLDFDCARLLGGKLAELGGRGGGKPEFAMGGGPGIAPGLVVRDLEATVRGILAKNA